MNTGDVPVEVEAKTNTQSDLRRRRALTYIEGLSFRSIFLNPYFREWGPFHISPRIAIVDLTNENMVCQMKRVQIILYHLECPDIEILGNTKMHIRT